MDRSVPAPAAILLAFIYKTETKTAAPACYNVIFGHNQAKLAKPLTTMTLGEVIDQQKSWTRRFKSSAAGAPQFMRATLQGLVKELNLSPARKLDADMQDRLAFHLLKRRGYEAFMAGKVSRTEFGKRLAQEWASFPVLKATKGGKRDVKRGQSYYAGDGLNKALVKPAEVEAVLDKVKGVKVAPEAAPAEPATGDIYADKTTVEIVQRKLSDLGYTEVGSRRADGSFDGVLGGMTKAAILIFRNDNGLPAVDVIDRQLLDALDTAPKRKLARNDATPEKVRETVPEAKSNWLNKILAAIVAVPALIGGIVDGAMDGLGSARGYVEPLLSAVPSWAWLLLAAGVAGYVFWNSRKGEQSSIAAFREGSRR